IVVRRYSYPNFTSCFPIFHEKLSSACQLESTRWRGSEWLAPSCEKGPTSITGNPWLEITAPVQSPVVVAAHSPTLLGSKFWSCGKNPSAKRFQPSRASFTLVGESTLTYEIETSCTLVGVNVLNPGSTPPPVSASGKLCLLSPK